MINKFMVIAAGVGVLGLGAVSAYAVQSHAQSSAITNPTPIVQTTKVQDVSSPSDTDNIQNDTGGVDLPDATVTSGASVKTEVAGQKDSKETGEGTTTDVNEVEDGN
jgi:cytoskeletal protein RodZ